MKLQEEETDKDDAKQDQEKLIVWNKEFSFMFLAKLQMDIVNT